MYHILFCLPRNSSQESVKQFKVDGTHSTLNDVQVALLMIPDFKLAVAWEFDSSQITELPMATPIPSTVPASWTLIWHAWIITATIMFVYRPRFKAQKMGKKTRVEVYGPV